MAEKRVSVRLVATGGKKVRAELEGIGDSAQKGLGRMHGVLGPLNAQLATFARRSAVAAGAAVAAAMVAAVAGVRAGLARIDAEAKLAQSLRTTVGSVQTLNRAADLAGVSMGEVEQATLQMTKRLAQAVSGAGPAAKALNALHLSATDLAKLPLDERMIAIQDAIDKYVPKAQRAAVASQLFGDRAGLVFARIDSATLRQATQDMRDFGVVVSDQDADQIERTNDAISRLGLIWRGLANRLAVAVAPALEAIAGALASITSVSGPVGRALSFLTENLGRVATYAATFAGLLGTRLVGGMALWAVATIRVGNALIFLRGALIRTGIGALIVGAGELVYWLSRLVKGAGGFGEAMGLLKDVVVEVWDRIKQATSAALSVYVGLWSAGILKVVEAVAGGMQSAIEAVVGFGNAAANTFEGAFGAIKAIWGQLPAAIGDLVYQAANSMIDGVEAMINGAISRLNWFGEQANKLLEYMGSDRRISLIGNLALPDLVNPFKDEAGKAGKAASEAFREAFQDDPFAVPDTGLSAIASGAGRRASEILTRIMADMNNGVTAPLKSWEALRAAIVAAGKDGASALDDATDSAGDFEDQIVASGGAGKKAAEETKVGWAAVAQSLSEYAKTALNWGKNLGDSLTGAFTGAENAFKEFVKTGKFDFKSLVASMVSDLALLSFKKNVLGPLAGWLGGLFGGGSIGASVFHSGGLVGAGGGSRAVPAHVFANAPRMHGGGWAGLRPNEVPAILERGERVLPRGSGADGGVSVVRLELTADLDARVARQSQSVAIDVVRAGIDAFSREALPYRVRQIADDPRAVG